jgi:hypothetical protein
MLQPAPLPTPTALAPDRAMTRPSRPTLRRFAASAALALLATSAAATAALGPNLLTNPNFDTNLSGWTNVSSSTWIATDGAGEIGSGAVRMHHPGSLIGIRPTQCVAVTAGVDYVGSALFRLSEASFPDGYVEIIYFADSQCNEPILSSTDSESLYAVDRWTRVGVVTRAPAGAKSAAFQINATAADETPQYADAAYFGRGTCAADPRQLCLNDDRFAVSATWQTASTSGEALTVPFGTDSGNFVFFNLDNVELNVKVLNGCGINQRYWVFAAGLTNAKVVLTVRDTKTGQTKTYTNPLGQVFAPVTDTGAFATCP